MGSIEDCYVLGVFDCCRVELPENLRGPGGGEEVDQQQDYRNCILTFGCPPRAGVPGASTIAVEYFDMLRKIADPEDGSIRLPGDRFYRWSPGGIGEHILLTNDDLYLKHKN